MDGERTVKCGICGEPYKIYSMYAGDQSACPDCRTKAEDRMKKRYQPWPDREN